MTETTLLLKDLIYTADAVREAGPKTGGGALAINTNIHDLALAKQLADLAKQIAANVNKELCRGVPRGELLEASDTGAVVQVSYSPTYKQWDQPAVRAAVRPVLLFGRKRNGELSKRPRSGAAVLDALWDPDNGLNPLNGNAMRIGKFKALGFDPSEFAEHTDGETATFISGKDALTINL